MESEEGRRGEGIVQPPVPPLGSWSCAADQWLAVSGLHLALPCQVAHLATVVAAVACRSAVASYMASLVAAVANVGGGVVSPTGLWAVSADVAKVATVVALAVVAIASRAVARDVSQLAAQVAPSLVLLAIP